MEPWGDAAASSSGFSSGTRSQSIKLGVLDISVTPMNAQQVASTAAVPSGKRLLLNHNLHSAYLHDTDLRFRKLYELADWVVVDGTPILWLSSFFARVWLPPSYRTSSTDWIAALPHIEASGRLFVYGATASSNARAVDHLRGDLARWTVSGVDGYTDDKTAVELINQFQPNLVIVGLGMPRQEHFLLRNFSQLPEATYATVGGAIDYLAGTTRLAPRWLGRFGIEWAWRLLNEPRRLAYRYLVEPIRLLRRIVVRNLCGRRRARRRT